MKPLAWLDAERTRAAKWIETAPSTNLNQIASTVMACVTGGVYLTSMVLGRHPEPISFGAWLAFLAGWKGINVQQFRVKRQTTWEPGKRPPAGVTNASP